MVETIHTPHHHIPVRGLAYGVGGLAATTAAVIAVANLPHGGNQANSDPQDHPAAALPPSATASHSPEATPDAAPTTPPPTADVLFAGHCGVTEVIGGPIVTSGSFSFEQVTITLANAPEGPLDTPAVTDHKVAGKHATGSLVAPDLDGMDSSKVVLFRSAPDKVTTYVATTIGQTDQGPIYTLDLEDLTLQTANGTVDCTRGATPEFRYGEVDPNTGHANLEQVLAKPHNAHA